MRKFKSLEDVVNNVGCKVVNKYCKVNNIDYVTINGGGSTNVSLSGQISYVSLNELIKEYYVLERGDFNKYSLKVEDIDTILKLSPSRYRYIYVVAEKKWGELNCYHIYKNHATITVAINGDCTEYCIGKDLLYISTLPEALSKM